MEAAQLWSYFKNEGITLEDIASDTGYSVRYVLDVLEGRHPLSDRTKFRIIDSFPETAAFLLNGGTPQPAPDALAESAGSGEE